MSARTLTWTVSARPGYPLPVLDGQVTVDAARCPQVTASLTLPYSSRDDVMALDPFIRKTVYLTISTSNYVPGRTLAEFGSGTTPGTLATLDWSQKTSTPVLLDSDPGASEVHNLRVYVTDVTVNEIAGTLSVELATADVFLTELRNLGSTDWEPAHSSTLGAQKRTRPNAVFEEFFDAFDLPLTVKSNALPEVLWYEAWTRGDIAWSYLDGLRTEADMRYRLNARTGVMTLHIAPSLPFANIDRSNATAVSYQRSVDNSAEGLNSYADAIINRYEFLENWNRPDQWLSSSAEEDWRRSRRSTFETEASSETYAIVPTQASLEYRRQRANRLRRLTTVTIPADPRCFPFADLATHPHAASITSLTFDYPSGDVTTTYVEQDI